MHEDVLESARYPDIAVRPDQWMGALQPSAQSPGDISTRTGIVISCSAPWMTNIPCTWTTDSTAHKWGMKNPSTFVLRVDQSVDIDIRGIW
jgi:hypothetical protein